MPSFSRLKSDVCCVDCFRDPELKKRLRQKGHKDYCGYCKKKSDCCADPSVIADEFATIASLYERADGGLHKFGEPLIEKIQSDWELFNSNDFRVRSDIFNKALQGESGKDPRLDPEANVIDPSDFYGEEEYYKKELITAWEKFCWEIKHTNRFLFNGSSDFRVGKNSGFSAGRA